MQKLTFRIEERPQKTETKKEQPGRRYDVSQKSLLHGDGVTLLRNQAHSPGLHRQCLAASPLPREINSCYDYEVGLVENANVHRGET